MSRNSIPLAAALAVSIGLILSTGCGTSDVSAAKAVGPDGKPIAPEAAPAPPAATQAKPITIPQGTVLKIRTAATISTHSAKTGEAVVASLAEPLMIDGMEVAPRGAEAILLVADSNPGGRVKGRAIIGLRLTNVQLAGAKQEVSSNIWWHEAPGTKKKDAAKIGILGGVGAAIGGIAGGGKGAAIGAGAGAGAGTGVVLATRGDPAVVPAESVLVFTLAQPVTINAKS